MCDGGPLDGAIAAEGESWLAVDVLRIPYVRAVVTLVYGHVYPRPFGMRLRGKKHKNVKMFSTDNRYYLDRTGFPDIPNPCSNLDRLMGIA